MSEYKRLTNKETYQRLTDKKVKGTIERYIRVDKDYILSAYDIVYEEKHDIVEMLINRLAELEDMIECGQLVFKSSLISKYKNGDTVYCILRGLENGMAYYVKEMKIRRIYLGKTKITYYLKGRKYGIGENQIFATKSEAEAKLKELR